MRIAYVNYGLQSGVTANVTRGLTALGHQLTPIDPTAVLALRNPRTRLPRPTPRVLMSLAVSALRHGPQALHHRLNTLYAFDQHSRRAGELLARLRPQPQIVLQNGALFAPGDPPRLPYVLLLDNTCMLAQRLPPVPEAGIGKHIAFGRRWLERERATYLGAAGIATFSNVVRRSLIDDYGADPRKIAVIGAGANVVPREAAREDDGRTLVFVGKDGWPRKGGPVLLRAFEMLREEHPDLRLLIAGPTEQLDLPPGATNLSLVSFEEVERLLRRATVFVLPTLREPFGIAFIDAMLCGAPCVGTRVGAVPEILGDAGVIVPPADAKALAGAISSLLKDEARRAAMGEAGRRRVLERGYLWPQVARSLAALLRRASPNSASSGMPSQVIWTPELEQPPPA
jgi:glycosyltransferase involved in cell wall biosynthesis